MTWISWESKTSVFSYSPIILISGNSALGVSPFITKLIPTILRLRTALINWVGFLMKCVLLLSVYSFRYMTTWGVNSAPCMRTIASLTSSSVSGTDQTGQNYSRLIPVTSCLYCPHLFFLFFINKSEWTCKNEYFKLRVRCTKSFLHVNISSAILTDIFQGVVFRGVLTWHVWV